MPFAARVTDSTTQGGTIVGPGVQTVLIGGKAAAVAFDTPICTIPPPHPDVSIFPIGSTDVLISGRPALRTSDAFICGSMAAVGSPTVAIGG